MFSCASFFELTLLNGGENLSFLLFLLFEFFLIKNESLFNTMGNKPFCVLFERYF